LDGLNTLFNKEDIVNVSICAYKIDSTLHTPFLKFGFEHKDTLQFPTFQFYPPNIAKQNGDEDCNDVTSTCFTNECYNHIISNSKENIIYKGFVEYNEQFYAIFDCTNVDIPDMIWGCIDEIVNIPFGQEYRNINNIPVDVYKMFYANPVLLFIKDEYGNVEIPQLMYLCNDVADNVLKYKMDGDYGFSFYFTSTPLDVTSVRCVGFIEHAEFNKIGARVYFTKDNVQYWAIKSIQDFTIL